MAIAGTAIFFDGITSARRAVVVELTSDGVLVRDAEDRDMLARWPYGELDHLAAVAGVLRIGRAGAKTTARLEVRDAALAQAIDEASVPVDRTKVPGHGGRTKVIAWSIAGYARSPFVNGSMWFPRTSNWPVSRSGLGPSSTQMRPAGKAASRRGSWPRFKASAVLPMPPMA